VKTEENSQWIHWISEHLQILPLSSWKDAAQFMEQLMNNKQMLEAYRIKLLSSWMACRENFYKMVGEWIKV
jgi:hypothetical protein